MLITKLQLSNFRNISKLNLNFDNSLTIFYGENGQGKTNIVESIYALANGQSFRTSYVKEMIEKNKSEATIIGEINGSKRKEKYQVILTETKKAAFVNDIVEPKFSDYIGKLNAICFSPEDVFIFKDSPSARRKFLDKELCSLFPIYIKQLILYKSVLEQRNDLLKGNIDNNLLEVLDEKLIESSYDIYKRRKWLVSKIEEFATVIYKKLTNESQKISMVYHTFLNEDDKDSYLEKGCKVFKNNLRKDKEKMFTTTGIHKDDFQVFLNDKEVDMFASQGQQRLVSLCVKLAVTEIVTKATKQEPIIILDDAFSELDANKKENLFNYVSNKNQVFITCTDYKNIVNNKNLKITLLKISNGNVVGRS